MSNGISGLGSFTNIPVYKGKEAEAKLPLEERVRAALNKNPFYKTKGTDELKIIAKFLAVYIMKIEKEAGDVIGLSINNDGSFQVKVKPERTAIPKGKTVEVISQLNKGLKMKTEGDNLIYTLSPVLMDLNQEEVIRSQITK